jgi:hypothetical protein
MVAGVVGDGVTGDPEGVCAVHPQAMINPISTNPRKGWNLFISNLLARNHLSRGFNKPAERSGILKGETGSREWNRNNVMDRHLVTEETLRKNR